MAWYSDKTLPGASLPGSEFNDMATVILAAYSVSTNYTGSGAYVRATSASMTSPTFVTPETDTIKPTSTSSGVSIKNKDGTAVLTVAAGSSSATTASFAGALSVTGSLTAGGASVLTASGALGTPSSGTLTNCTGLPVSSGISGFGTGIATFLATPSSANLATAITDETGSGSLVFGTSPTMSNVTISTLVMNTTDISKIRNASYNSEIDDGNSGTSKTIDFSSGSLHKLTLTGNVTLTFTAPPANTRVQLRTIQGSGPYTITWPASVKHVGATAPTLGTTNGRSDIHTMFFDGTNYWNVSSVNFN